MFGERFIDGRLMVETQRLRLRTWRDEDLDLLLEMQGDPETMRYMADGHCPDRGECAEAIEQIESHCCEHGFGIWAAEMRATGELVGWVGLTTPGWLPEVMPAVEVGYLFGRVLEVKTIDRKTFEEAG